MRRGASVALLTVLLGGGVCPRSAAQGFNIRYDLVGWGVVSSTFGVEQNQAGDIVTFSNTEYLDTATNLYWSSIANSVRFSSAGQYMSHDSVFDPQRASYVGWSNCSTMLADGRIVVSGSLLAPDTPRAVLYWFDQNGALLDRKEFVQGSHSWIAYQHKNTPDGGFIVVGVAGVNGLPQDNLLFKTDSLGNLEWWRTYGHPTRMDVATSVDCAPDGGYYVGGTYPVTSVLRVQWVMRTDGAGDMVWQLTPGIPINSTFSAEVISCSDGNIIYACGESDGSEHHLRIAKLDTSGTLLWGRSYGDPHWGSGFFSISEVPSSMDLVACGQKGHYTQQGNISIWYCKGVMLRANSQGDSLWMYEYAYYDSLMGEAGGVLRDVQPTSDGGFVAVGDAGGSISGNNPPGLSADVWVVKVDSMGCIVPGCNDIPTGITAQITNLPNAVLVRPNPAHGTAVVDIQLPSGAWEDPQLTVVDAQGRVTHTRRAAQGANMLDLHGWAAGLYHLHLVNSGTWLGGAKLVVE